mgnify:CR=1 FL=1
MNNKTRPHSSNKRATFSDHPPDYIGNSGSNRHNKHAAGGGSSDDGSRESVTHTPRLMLEHPMDGPWQRIKEEWKNPNSWFGIDDCGRLIDVPNSFGGTQTIYKWIITLWLIASIIYVWSTESGGGEDFSFLGNLDHWALLTSFVYCLMSLGNGHFRPPQPPVASEGVILYVKVFWILFELAAHWELLTAFLFWTIIFPKELKEGYKIGYGTFLLHGLVTLMVLFDGMILNRIPVRIKHYFILLAFDVIYVIWTMIHAAAGLGGQPASPESGADQQSEAIYLALDWRNETVQTIFICIGILTVFAPILFLFQYLMSLYSFPWEWNGNRSRLCIEFDMSTSATARVLNTRAPHNPQYTRRDRPPTPAPHKAKRTSNDTSTQQSNANSETSRTSSHQNRPSTPGPRPSTPGPRPSTPGPRPSTPGPRPTTPNPSRRTSTTADQVIPRQSSRSGDGKKGRPSASSSSATLDTPSVVTTPTALVKPKRKKKPSILVASADKRQGRPTPKRDLSRMDIA